MFNVSQFATESCSQWWTIFVNLNRRVKIPAHIEIVQFSEEWITTQSLHLGVCDAILDSNLAEWHEKVGFLFYKVFTLNLTTIRSKIIVHYMKNINNLHLVGRFFQFLQPWKTFSISFSKYISTRKRDRTFFIKVLIGSLPW